MSYTSSSNEWMIYTDQLSYKWIFIYKPAFLGDFSTRGCFMALESL
jgi:hypothetical protein